MGQCCLKGSAEFGISEKRTFKTDGWCEKLKSRQSTVGRGFTKTSLPTLCVGYTNGITESKSGK